MKDQNTRIVRTTVVGPVGRRLLLRAAEVPIDACFVISLRELDELVSEFEFLSTPVAFIEHIADLRGSPVVLWMADESTLSFVRPNAWSQERLLGWIGGKAEELTKAYGRLGSVRMRAANTPPRKTWLMARQSPLA